MPELHIAVGQFATECNDFGGLPTDLDTYARHELFYGADMLQEPTGAVAGALDALRASGVEVVPLMSAASCAGGPLTAECYAHIRDEMLARLEDAGRVDGVLLALHRAATAAGVGDPEGDILGAVRARVGPRTPVVATLDLHAHVAADMVRHADALLGFETYPHRDARSTGERAARLLLGAASGASHPTVAMVKSPMVTSAIHASTDGDDPFARVMHAAKAMESREGVLSTSVFLVHPALDQPGMGSGGLVVTDGDTEAAAALAGEITAHYWSLRGELEPTLHSPEQAVSEGLDIAGGPVILVEAADCCGGGASGDSVASLRALLQAGAGCASLVPVVDPSVAEACHRAGVGGSVSARVGHRLDPQWGEPISVTGRVERLTDGRFEYAGERAGMAGDMGPSAVLRVGAIDVLVTTHPTYDWLDEQFLSVGLDPSAAKFIVAKNPMNYRQAYGAIAKETFFLDTPGPTPPTFREWPYTRQTQPWYPRDEDMEYRATLLR